MQQIDLDDLPPKVARMLEGLAVDEEVTLVRSGVGVICLRITPPPPPPIAPARETDMAEVMEHFGAIIEDEF